MYVFRATVLMIPVLLAGCEAKHDTSRAPASQSAHDPSSKKLPSVTVVRETNMVCMVNNQYMGREQIPVVVDKRTYFGCCPMCKERLERDATLRSAIDPVSRRPVDKAAAVIGKTAKGDVLYFENHENLQRYAAR